ncbi:MAG: hypothetical protein N2689_08295 [Verrucomicrobiae bacterium]|nr:hypothetical protein [Verrucomicrobiae bacterium]
MKAIQSLALACASLAGSAAIALEPDINPYPRQVLETQRLHEWTFETGAAGWRALHHCALAASNGVLKIQSSGHDPYLLTPSFRVEGPFRVNLRARCAAAGNGEFFWMTDKLPHTDPDRSQHFTLIHDGQWHDYSVPLPAEGTVTGLRLDPGTAPGLVEIEKVELVRDILHPLEIQSLRADGRCVTVLLKNHSPKPISATVSGREIALDAGSTSSVVAQIAGSAPFEAGEIVVESENLPALRRPVFIADPAASADWVICKSGDLTLRVARDGSGARLERAGKLVGFIAPLVSLQGALPKLKLTGPLRFSGDGVALSLALHGDEIVVDITSDAPCEGPVLRALGPLEQGVFAGLEYLGKGERSSSTLDIETEEHIRFAPDPLKVTMPLMAFVTDRVSTAMTWRDMSLQPVFATPNFLDGAEGHRAALRGRKIQATILVRPPARIEDAILWAVKKRGLLPLPKPPRDPKAQAELCLRALSGPPLKTDAGWGHCAEPHWPRHPFADMASTIWRLTGQAPQFPKLVPGGAHIRNDAIYFVTGRANEWLRLGAGEVKRILADQKPDGSFRYNGKYARGHFEDTASGYCAHNALPLLQYARFTGDEDALAAGIKALDFMKRFRTPRGAQTWECPLHTPDILASAHLVRACVLGYELTGRGDYLDDARRWAISGLPFVYQWSRHPIMNYATIAVLGATNWRAPNWIGLPVQWCGHVCAYALTTLAPHDKTLDWKRLAEGIQIAAEQMQYPDGEYAGCLPDSFDLASQQRRPWNINPSALVSLRLVLDGKLDSLAVACDGRHRVVAPFPVTLRDGKARIAARAGVRYEVVVDGARVVPIASRGTDELDLE